MNNTGQCCVAAKRLIVVEALADRFLDKFGAALGALEPGDLMDLDRGTVLPQMVPAIAAEISRIPSWHSKQRTQFANGSSRQKRKRKSTNTIKKNHENYKCGYGNHHSIDAIEMDLAGTNDIRARGRRRRHRLPIAPSLTTLSQQRKTEQRKQKYENKTQHSQ